MSAMDQMLASMLGKMIPAEVLELLSPENIQELKEMAGSFVAKISEDLETIKAQNAAIQFQLSTLQLKEIENVNKLSQPDDNGSGNRSRRRRSNGSGEPSGSD